MDTKPVPWRRFWARNFDYFLHAFIVAIIWSLIDYESILAINENLLGFIMMVIWIFLDGIYMTLFGTTIGKKIMKIKISLQDGSKLSKYIAFKRSRLVWLRGMGLGIGIIQLIANIISYRNLTKDGITSWDRELGLEVSYEKVGVLRYLICPVFLICVIALIIYSYV